MTTANKTKTTLNSIIFAAAPAIRELAEGEKHTKTEIKEHSAAMVTHVNEVAGNLAKYFVDKSLSTGANLDLLTQILTAAVAAVPSVLEAEQAAKVAEAEAKEKAREEAEAEKEKERKQREEEAAAEADKMLQVLLAANVDLNVAKAMIAAAPKVKAAQSGPKNSYDRVAITVNGKGFDIPVRGNMSQELKDLQAAEGFADDRDAFIAKFRNEPAAADTAQA